MKWLREWWKANSGYVTTVCVVLGIFVILSGMGEIMGEMFPETPQEKCNKQCVAKGFESGKYDSEMFQTFEECWCYDNGNVTQIW